MRLFQVVKTVLDELYAQIPLPTEEAKDEAIKNEIVALRKQYRALMSTGRVDYSNFITVNIVKLDIRSGVQSLTTVFTVKFENETV